MKTRPIQKKNGYSLVEILVTASIMMVAVAAACVMTLVTIGQEEGGTRAARALNYFENAMRLYQLGLTPAEIEAVIPVEPSVTSLSMVAGDGTVTGVGVLERMDMRLQFRTAPIKDSGGTDIVHTPGKWVGGSGVGVRSTATFPVYRTSIRAAI